jgi:hypothetical protein
VKKALYFGYLHTATSYSGHIGKQVPGKGPEQAVAAAPAQAKPAGQAPSEEHGAPGGALESTHAWSKLPQCAPEQNRFVAGPRHTQLPAHGWPQAIEPPAQVGTVVVVFVVVVVVLVVGGVKGAHRSWAMLIATVLLPN